MENKINNQYADPNSNQEFQPTIIPQWQDSQRFEIENAPVSDFGKGMQAELSDTSELLTPNPVEDYKPVEVAYKPTRENARRFQYIAENIKNLDKNTDDNMRVAYISEALSVMSPDLKAMLDTDAMSTLSFFFGKDASIGDMEKVVLNIAESMASDQELETQFNNMDDVEKRVFIASRYKDRLGTAGIDKGMLAYDGISPILYRNMTDKEYDQWSKEFVDNLKYKQIWNAIDGCGLQNTRLAFALSTVESDEQLETFVPDLRKFNNEFDRMNVILTAREFATKKSYWNSILARWGEGWAGVGGFTERAWQWGVATPIKFKQFIDANGGIENVKKSPELMRKLFRWDQLDGNRWNPQEDTLSGEKLSPMRMTYHAESYEDALSKVDRIYQTGKDQEEYRRVYREMCSGLANNYKSEGAITDKIIDGLYYGLEVGQFAITTALTGGVGGVVSATARGVAVAKNTAKAISTASKLAKWSSRAYKVSAYSHKAVMPYFFARMAYDAEMQAIDAGLNDTQAMWYGMGVGLINSFLEKIQFNLRLKNEFLGSKVANAILRKKNVFKAITTRYALNSAKKRLKGFGEEFLVENLQNMVQELGLYFSAKLSDKEYKEFKTVVDDLYGQAGEMIIPLFVATNIGLGSGSAARFTTTLARGIKFKNDHSAFHKYNSLVYMEEAMSKLEEDGQPIVSEDKAFEYYGADAKGKEKILTELTGKDEKAKRKVRGVLEDFSAKVTKAQLEVIRGAESKIKSTNPVLPTKKGKDGKALPAPVDHEANKKFFQDFAKAVGIEDDVIYYETLYDAPEHVINELKKRLREQGISEQDFEKYIYTGQKGVDGFRLIDKDGKRKMFVVGARALTPQRTLEIVKHETGHRGADLIRGTKEFNTFLDNLLDSAGGEDIVRIAMSRVKGGVYDKLDRYALAEEFMCTIAEKVIERSQLSEQEQKTWAKIVNFFVELMANIPENPKHRDRYIAKMINGIWHEDGFEDIDEDFFADDSEQETSSEQEAKQTTAEEKTPRDLSASEQQKAKRDFKLKILKRRLEDKKLTDSEREEIKEKIRVQEWLNGIPDENVSEKLEAIASVEDVDLLSDDVLTWAVENGATWAGEELEKRFAKESEAEANKGTESLLEIMVKEGMKLPTPKAIIRYCKERGLSKAGLLFGEINDIYNSLRFDQKQKYFDGNYHDIDEIANILASEHGFKYEGSADFLSDFAENIWGQAETRLSFTDVNKPNASNFNFNENEREIYESAVVPKYYYKSSTEALKATKERLRVPVIVENKKLGMSGILSAGSLNEMKSDRAMSKTKFTSTPNVHTVALANIEELFEGALFDITSPDKKGVLKNMHRLYVSMYYNDKLYGVQITVKESESETTIGDKKSNNKIYSLEAVDVENLFDKSQEEWEKEYIRRNEKYLNKKDSEMGGELIVPQEERPDSPNSYELFSKSAVTFFETIINVNKKLLDNARFSFTDDRSSEAQRQYDEVVAKYKDTDQWLKAPNGKDTNLTERQWVMVRTPNFKNWFGDWENDPENASKVVDENGEPLVVYHGSSWNPLEEAKGNAVFDSKFIGTSSGDVGWYGKGHYFAYTKYEASTYGGNVGGYFLNIRNPFMFQENLGSLFGTETSEFEADIVAPIVNLSKIFQNIGKQTFKYGTDSNGDFKTITFAQFAKEIEDIEKSVNFKAYPIGDGIYGKEWGTRAKESKRVVDLGNRAINKKYAENKILNVFKYWKLKNDIGYLRLPRLRTIIQESSFTEDLKAMGYDGVLQSKYGDEVVAFNSNQIKSATDNVGTFDGENPDIRFSFVGKNANADFIPVGYKKSLSSLLKEAIDLFRDDSDIAEIYSKTGWYLDDENPENPQWKFEVQNPLYDFFELGVDEKLDKNESLFLSDIFPEDAPIFKVYPHLKNIIVVKDSRAGEAGFIADENSILLNPFLWDGIHNTKEALSGFSNKEIKEDYIKRQNFLLQYSLEHELQHAIQSHEGFDNGSSPQSFVKILKRYLDCKDLINNTTNIPDRIKIPVERFIEKVEKKLGITESDLQDGDIDNNIMEYAWAFYHNTKGEIEAFTTKRRLQQTKEERNEEPFFEAEKVVKSDLQENDKRDVNTIFGSDWNSIKSLTEDADDILSNLLYEYRLLQSNEEGHGRLLSNDKGNEEKSSFISDFIRRASSHRTSLCTQNVGIGAVRRESRESPQKNVRFSFTDTRSYEEKAELNAKFKDLYEQYKNGDQDAYKQAVELVKAEAERKGYVVKVYHGTGADGFNVAKADSSEQQNGEGAQAHGGGLYMAVSRDVAKKYKHKGIINNGKIVDNLINLGFEIPEENSRYFLSYLKDYLEAIIKSGVKKRSDLFDRLGLGFVRSEFDVINEKLGIPKKIYDLAEEKGLQLDELLRKIQQDGGRVFNWLHNMKPTELIDEDLPLSKQNEEVQKKIKEFLNRFTEIEIKGKKGFQSKVRKYLDTNGGRKNIDIDLIDNVIHLWSHQLTGHESSNWFADYDNNRLKLIKDLGIKGLTYDGRQDGRCYVSFEGGSAVKLQDPFTFDDNGELIPLTERFDEENPDMRFSFADNKRRGVNKIEFTIPSFLRNTLKTARQFDEYWSDVEDDDLNDELVKRILHFNIDNDQPTTLDEYNEQKETNRSRKGQSGKNSKGTSSDQLRGKLSGSSRNAGQGLGTKDTDSLLEELRRISRSQNRLGKKQKIKTRSDAIEWIKNNVLSGPFRDNAPKRFHLDRFENYKKGVSFPVSEILQRLLDTTTTEFANLSVFDRIRIGAVLQRAEGKNDYSPTYSSSKNENAKSSGGYDFQNEKSLNSVILVADTIRGCDNDCWDCYANNNSKQSAINFGNKVRMFLDKLNLDEENVLRLGTVGDPASDWTHSRNEVIKVFERAWGKGKNVSFEKNMFVITKLQTLQGFDPTIFRNLQVSLDPFYPEDTFVAMKNMAVIMALYPDVNINVRIRSLDTIDENLKDMQDRCIQFCQAHNLRVLETRMRFGSKIAYKLIGLRESNYKQKEVESKKEDGKLVKISQYVGKERFLPKYYDSNAKDRLFFCGENGELGCGACMNCVSGMTVNRERSGAVSPVLNEVPEAPTHKAKPTYRGITDADMPAFSFTDDFSHADKRKLAIDLAKKMYKRLGEDYDVMNPENRKEIKPTEDELDEIYMSDLSLIDEDMEWICDRAEAILWKMVSSGYSKKAMQNDFDTFASKAEIELEHSQIIEACVKDALERFKKMQTAREQLKEQEKKDAQAQARATKGFDIDELAINGIDVIDVIFDAIETENGKVPNEDAIKKLINEIFDFCSEWAENEDASYDVAFEKTKKTLVDVFDSVVEQITYGSHLKSAIRAIERLKACNSEKILRNRAESLAKKLSEFIIKETKDFEEKEAKAKAKAEKEEAEAEAKAENEKMEKMRQKVISAFVKFATSQKLPVSNKLDVKRELPAKVQAYLAQIKKVINLGSDAVKERFDFLKNKQSDKEENGGELNYKERYEMSALIIFGNIRGKSLQELLFAYNELKKLVEGEKNKQFERMEKLEAQVAEVVAPLSKGLSFAGNREKDSGGLGALVSREVSMFEHGLRNIFLSKKMPKALRDQISTLIANMSRDIGRASIEERRFNEAEMAWLNGILADCYGTADEGLARLTRVDESLSKFATVEGRAMSIGQIIQIVCTLEQWQVKEAIKQAERKYEKSLGKEDEAVEETKKDKELYEKYRYWKFMKDNEAEMRNLLTEADWKFVQALQGKYAQRLEQVNPLYEKLNGLPMLSNGSNYMPIVRAKERNWESDFNRIISIFPEYYTPRVISLKEIDENANVLHVFVYRMQSDAHFLNFAEITFKMQELFGNDDFKKAMDIHLSKNEREWLHGMRMDVLTGVIGNQKKSVNEQIVSALAKISAYSGLWMNLTSATKQLSAFPAFLLKCDFNDVWDGFKKAIGNGEFFSAMGEFINSDYMKDRCNSGELNQILSEITKAENDLKNGISPARIWKRKLSKIGFAPIAIMDKYAHAICGGMIYYSLYKKYCEVYPEAEAKRLALLDASSIGEMTQQSALVQNLGETQRGKESFGKLFTQFRTANRQYLSFELNAIVEAIANPNKETLARAGKTIFLNHILLPVLFNGIGIFMNALLGDDIDDDDWEYFLKSTMLNAFLDVFTGWWASAILSGFIKLAVLHDYNGKVADSMMSATTMFRLLDAVVYAYRDFNKNGWDDFDVWKHLDRVGKASFAPYRIGKKLYDNIADNKQGTLW